MVSRQHRQKHFDTSRFYYNAGRRIARVQTILLAGTFLHTTARYDFQTRLAGSLVLTLASTLQP